MSFSSNADITSKFSSIIVESNGLMFNVKNDRAKNVWKKGRINLI